MRLIEHDPATLDIAISLATRLGSLSVLAASSASDGHHHGDHGNAMDLSALGLNAIKGLEQQTGDGDDDAVAPVTRAEFKQLLAALQQQRSGAGAANRGGKRAPFGRGARGAPRVQGLSEQEVRKRLDGGLCFACGEAGHRKSDCPQNDRKQSGN